MNRLRFSRDGLMRLLRLFWVSAYLSYMLLMVFKQFFRGFLISSFFLAKISFFSILRTQGYVDESVPCRPC